MTPSSDNKTSPRVLIVEDERIVAKDLEARVSRLGYGVCANVASGEAAIERAEAERPNLVLMDIMLKGEMDGIQAAEHIQRGLKLPVVYITAHADMATYAKAMGTEPAGYLVKPFSDRMLKLTLEQALTAPELDLDE